jgi:N-acetyl-alpha-D-muramate 1-phosphate uridylyltransferase
MRGMILAAGRGERMGELTANTPKPLLKLNGLYLIEYSLLSLAKIGVQDVVVNVCYQKEKIIRTLGNGSRYQLNIEYSEEEVALETGGGIVKALPLLGDQPFIVLSSDVVTAYPLQNLPQKPEGLAHLVLVDNPDYHMRGDFCLAGSRIYCGDDQTFTFGNIGVYRPELFDGLSAERFRLGDLLKKEILLENISGEHYQGGWFNIGSPEELSSAALYMA